MTKYIGPKTDGENVATQADVGLVIPTGAVMPYAGTTAPTGWLLCDGSEKAVATYGALDTVLGTTYGNRTNGSGGAGSSHFRLPDLRGRAVFGKDNMGGTAASRVTNSGTDNSGIAGGTLGASGGDQRLHQHTHTQNSHNHTQDSHFHGLVGGGAATGNGILTTGGSGGAATQSATATNQATTATNQNTGTGSSQNMPPSLVLNYIIKT